MMEMIKKYSILALISGLSMAGISQTKDLGYYLNEGLKNSPLLNDLKNQLHSASLDSLIIKAQRKPLVEGKSELLYTPYNDHFGYDEAITNGGNYQVVASVSQNIFNRKIIENKYQEVSNQKQSIGISRKLTTAELKKTITELYLESYSAFSELLFSRSFLALLKNEDKIVIHFVADGIYSQTDYISLLVETEGQEVIVTQLKNQYVSDIMLLNEACGIIDTSFIELSKPILEPALGKASSKYLFQRPFEIDSLQIINKKNTLGLRYRPTISWYADAGLLTSDPSNFYNHFGTSAGISLSIPIYDGRQRAIEEQKLSVRENTRYFYDQSTRKMYDQAYLRLKGELDGMKEVKNNLEKQFGLADQLVRSLKPQLEAGIVKMTDYLTAIKTFRSVRHSLNMTEIQILSLINEMNYILAE